MVGLEDVAEGSTVTVTWYRVDGLEKRENLLSDEIAVGPGDLAFSQAIAPDGLAPGFYDAAATMAGHTTHRIGTGRFRGRRSSADCAAVGGPYAG